MKRKLLFVIILLGYNVTFSQTGIGTHFPDASAVLEMSSDHKGVLFPRVDLKSHTDNTTIVNPAKGLVVFNTGMENSFNVSGFYYWNGEEWKRLIEANSYPAEIDLLQCNGATLTPSTYVAGELYEGSLIIPYVGGNGGSYSSSSIQLPTNNGTMTYSLQGGQLSYGNGNVIFNVKGVPAVSSPQLTDFNIDFLGQNCIAKVGNANKIDYVTYARNTVSPIDGFALVNSVTTIGNLKVRYNGPDPSVAGFIEFAVDVPTHVSWLYRKGGVQAINMESYGQVAVVPGMWYRFGTGNDSNINTNNRDIGEMSLTLHNTKEIYRISLSVNNDITGQNGVPPTLSSATIFVEKLGDGNNQ